ncbi:MAG: hypothetical protein CMP12_01065 [Zunongwangia sp.]|nr:hypothetical protein [Zunongwangia sp.]
MIIDVGENFLMKYSVNNNNDLKEGYESLVKSITRLHEVNRLFAQYSHLNTEKVAMVIYKTATYGWYIDDFSKNSGININTCLKHIYNNLPEKLDAYFTDYYKGKIEKIRKRLVEKYSSRKEILNEAFESYNKGYYCASICILLTQIDGICNDILEAKFFVNKNYLPQIKEKLENKNLKYSDFILSPIFKKASINSWEKEIEKFPIRLNRHEIIHGVDINYGNEKNSLKVISMISYIDFVLSHYNSN